MRRLVRNIRPDVELRGGTVSTRKRAAITSKTVKARAILKGVLTVARRLVTARNLLFMAPRRKRASVERGRGVRGFGQSEGSKQDETGLRCCSAGLASGAEVRSASLSCARFGAGEHAALFRIAKQILSALVLVRIGFPFEDENEKEGRGGSPRRPPRPFISIDRSFSRSGS